MQSAVKMYNYLNQEAMKQTYSHRVPGTGESETCEDHITKYHTNNDKGLYFKNYIIHWNENETFFKFII